VGAALLVLGPAVLALGCGHSIGPGIAANHPDGFDFLRPPPCDLALPPASGEEPADEVTVRYLGAGGLYVGWRGEAILTGPFFSNPGLVEVGLRPMRFRWGAIRQGVSGVPMARVGAILAGHSHYDHIGDLPVVAGHLAPWTRLYLNRSGAHALGPYPRLRERVVTLECHEGEWIHLTDAVGRPLPFRVRAVPSEHAPHFDGVTLWNGETPELRRPWRRYGYPRLEAGRTHAFVIDLLDSTSEGSPARFRIYYQDSASEAPAGIPPDELLGRPYDLAVVVMASAHLVKPYPEDLLRALAPRHVLVIHYEDFFSPWDRRRGFVPLLTRARAEAFLRRVGGALEAGGQTLAGPAGGACGPSAEGWTMPLIEEWIAFRSSLTEETVEQTTRR
jgi:hypothetical protein